MTRQAGLALLLIAVLILVPLHSPAFADAGREAMGVTHYSDLARFSTCERSVAPLALETFEVRIHVELSNREYQTRRDGTEAETIKIPLAFGDFPVQSADFQITANSLLDQMVVDPQGDLLMARGSGTCSLLLVVWLRQHIVSAVVTLLALAGGCAWYVRKRTLRRPLKSI